MDMSTHSHSSMASASEMPMTYFTSTTTSLYSTSFTPTTTAGYAGMCIFLILLSLAYRSLFALKALLEVRWQRQALKRRYVVVADKLPESERMRRDPDAKTVVLSANGVEEEVRIVSLSLHGAMPWRFSVDLPRAALVVLIVCVGYLLMLAVMTLNIGYFMSVAAGAFIGELLVGRFDQTISEHH